MTRAPIPPHPSWQASRTPSPVSALLVRLASAVAVLLTACSDPTVASGPDHSSESSPSSPSTTSSADAGRRDTNSGASGSGTKSDAGRATTSNPAPTSRDSGVSSPSARNDAGDDSGPASKPDDSQVSAADAGSTTSASGRCGSGKRSDHPFGCTFAWGTNQPDGPLAPYKDLSFVSKWVGFEVDKSGTLARCDGCSWLTEQVAPTSVVPVYYAYFIGYFGSANGFGDMDRNPNGPNLATDGAKLIRDQRAKIIDIYASYAKQTAKVWPDKPLVWLLEGDFVQYTYKEQKSPLSLAELGDFARDITCAIKGNMPNAVVAINHSTWLSDDVTNGFWDAMNVADYDMVWTTGVANNRGYLEAKATDDTYNHATATFKYLRQKTGRKLLVDQGFGLSAMTDTWSTATPATLGERIADGVIAVNAGTPSANYVTTVKSLTPKLTEVCK